MEFLHQLAEAYADQFTSPESDLLAEVNKQTLLQHPKAHMLSGKVQGQFLRFISYLQRPRYILEIGTFTGYSALCLAEGLPSDGILHTIEIREADARTAGANFSKFNQNKQVTLHRGNALEIIDSLPFQWDLVFIDADKTGYINYYEKLVPRLSERGIILADNVLFHGQVLEEPVSGKNALAIHAFNEHVKNDPRTEQVILTIRDGISFIKRK
ncbi:MAG: O-methyltransferase [Sphingobacteriia bacterium]|nr:O-methyltransferase [Sphingobacteriia bacterium]